MIPARMEDRPDVTRNRLPTIPARSGTWNKVMHVGHHVMPRASREFFRDMSCAEFRPRTLLRQRQRASRRSRSCPPVLPDWHTFFFDADDPIVRRQDRAWALKYPEAARQVLITHAAAASWRAWESWEGWSSGWQEGSGWQGGRWNSAGSGWSDHGAWAWINRHDDPIFIMTCIEAVTASIGEEVARAAAGTTWWSAAQQHDGGHGGARGSRN